MEWNRLVLESVRALASGEYVPLAFANANVDFQIARGNAAGCDTLAMSVLVQVGELWYAQAMMVHVG